MIKRLNDEKNAATQVTGEEVTVISFAGEYIGILSGDPIENTPTTTVVKLKSDNTPRTEQRDTAAVASGYFKVKKNKYGEPVSALLFNAADLGKTFLVDYQYADVTPVSAWFNQVLDQFDASVPGFYITSTNCNGSLSLLGVPQVVFSSEVLASFVNSTYFKLYDTSDVELTATVALLGDKKTVTITPASQLPANAKLWVSDAVQGVNGKLLSDYLTAPVVYSFAVVNQAPTFTQQPTVTAQTATGWTYSFKVSDPENQSLTFTQKIDSGSYASITPTLTNGVYSVSVTGQTSAGHTFSVKVSDGTNEVASDTVSVTLSANQAPTVTVSISGNGTIGNVLTATTTVGSDAEGDTVSSTAWRWLRDGVAISGATANTHTVVVTDAGTTLTAEATVTMSAGTNPLPATATKAIPNSPSSTFSNDFTSDDIFDSVNLGQATSGNTTITVSGGFANIANESVAADAGLIYLKRNVSKSETKTYKHKFKVTQCENTGNAGHVLRLEQRATAPAPDTATNTNANSRLVVQFLNNSTNGIGIQASYKDTNGTDQYYNTSNVWSGAYTGAKNIVVPTLNTIYEVDFVCDSTGITVNILNASGTVLATLPKVNWSSIKDDAVNPFWISWGDPYSANYVFNMATDKIELV